MAVKTVPGRTDDITKNQPVTRPLPVAHGSHAREIVEQAGAYTGGRDVENLQSATLYSQAQRQHCARTVFRLSSDGTFKVIE